MLNKIIKGITACAISVSILPTYPFLSYQNTSYQNIITANALTSADYSLSQNGVEFICKYEGFNPKCYRDNTQQSIGYGSKCGDGTLHTAGTHSITRDAALQLMISKINSEYAPYVRQCTKGLEMTQNQFDALCSMCYNTWQIKNSPLVRYLRGEISEATARSENAEYRINKGTKYESGLRNRRTAEADLFFKDSPTPIIPTPSTGCFQACGSGYTSIVEALKSIGVDSSYSYRAKIAAANGISGYSGSASQNTQMLNLLKAGTLKVPGDDPVPEPPPIVDYGETYFPACSSSFTSLVDALKSIGVDSSMSYRKTIAEKNGISGYSGSASQNTQMLNLLKSGKLLNPSGTTSTPDTSGKYFPACSSGASSIVDALKSIGVDSSMSYRKSIAEKNGISGYSGSASQNTQMLNLLKSGTLIKPEYTEPPAIVNYTVSLNANGGSSPIDSMSIASNSTYNGLPTPSREGYSFAGWYTDANGGSQVSDGNALVSNSNHTLYAHWNANTYTVSFDQNDGSGITSSKTVVFNNTYGELASPSRTGYTLAGWYTSSNDGNQINPDSKFTNADNQTLYAHWNANKYTVSFDLNGGTGSISDKTVEYDEVYGTLQEPTRKGYIFNGWFTSKENGQKISGESRVAITSNQILYAQWEKSPEEELKLDKNIITLKNGEQYKINANQDSLTYKSNNNDVVVVSDTGIVTAIGAGNAIISVINNDADVVQLTVNVVALSKIGDCNNDDQFNIADAVMLQNWILADSDTHLKYWEAADLYGDGVINSFDLVMMKKLLTKK